MSQAGTKALTIINLEDIANVSRVNYRLSDDSIKKYSKNGKLY